MRIAIIGKFQRLYDEEYIARSFEMLGHDVLRVPDNCSFIAIFNRFDEFQPHICIFTKYEPTERFAMFQQQLRLRKIKSICWIFDLYWEYPREYRITTAPFFKADIVVTTDGGHDDKWRSVGIKHYCVRQGIYREECKMLDPGGLKQRNGVIFIGSHNGWNEERIQTIQKISDYFGDRFKWYGKKNTHEVRGMALNALYAQPKTVVIGDSVWSPHYWSNRVVETLGRGGFLIHVEVPGLKEEYPDLVTYTRGDVAELIEKIKHYLNKDEEREAIRQKNYELVKNNYTMDKKCEELLNLL